MPDQLQEGAAGRLQRIVSRASWRADRSTAAVLIGGLFLYLAVVSIRLVQAEVTTLVGSCSFPAGTADLAGSQCFVPAWLRVLAGVGLGFPTGDLLVVAGCGLLVVRRPSGKAVVLAGLGLMVVAEVLGMAIRTGNHQVDSLGSLWREMVTTLWFLLLGLVVATLPVVPSSPNQQAWMRPSPTGTDSVLPGR